MARLNPSFTGEILASDWEGQLVVAFGDVRVDAAIPEDLVWRVANPSADAMASLQQNLTPERLLEGLAFVVPEKMSASDAEAVVEIQKLLMFFHYKYVFFPKKSLSTVDALGVREEPLPDVMREINVLRNYPWLFSSPLSDKLANERLGLPLMVILPGPSMKEVLPKLKEIRERCLIACIGRTINDCINAGVVPDIVIQLDTYQIQRNFYEQLPEMPETILVPLSITPFFPYAHKFRGVVMMDSFNLELLPNPARMRESYVSTITACLGLAEALHSPHAFIAGANLSSPLSIPEHPYAGRTDGPMPIFPSQANLYYLNARNGEAIEVWDYFIATAKEVEHFAQAIAETTGTRFYSTTDSTLLSRQWFPHGPVELINQLPQLDRQSYLAAVDRVLEQRETINVTKARMNLLRQLDDLRGVEKMYVGGRATQEVLDNHTLTKVARKMRNPILLGEVNATGVAARMSTKWRTALNDARLLVQAITEAGRGKTQPIVCFSDEIEHLTAVLTHIMPQGAWEYVSIATSPYPPFAEGDSLNPNLVLDWLGRQKVAFVSPRMMTEFSYLFDLAPDENVYDLRLIVG